MSRRIPHLRWWIGGILFASTVIDRQTLSLLAPYLKQDYHWSNSDYANIVIAFRIAYSVGQAVFGRLMDRIGARRGLSITVACYSVGHFLDARHADATHSFDPIILVAALVPLVGMILVLFLVRNTHATEQGLVRRI
jgi:MFS family permease